MLPLLFLCLLFQLSHALELILKSNYPLRKNNLPSVLREDNYETILSILKTIPEIKEVHYEKKGEKLYLYVERYPVIRRIEIEGNLFLRDEDVKNVLGIEEGMPLVDVSEESLEEVLRNVYREMGFLGASVSVDLTVNEKGEAYLRVKVEEGNLYFLKDVIFEGAKSLKKEQLLRVGGLVRGRVVNVSELRDAEVSLEKYYRKKGFFESFVFLKDIEREELGGPFFYALFPQRQSPIDSLSEGLKNLFTHPIATLKALLGKGRGAVAHYEVFEGEKYTISFEGNRFFSEERLRELLGYDFYGLDYFLLERFREKISRAYREKGFFDAEVSYTFRDRRVNFRIREGKRYRAILHLNGRREEFPYDEKLIDEKIEKELEKLKRAGYLEARAEREERVDRESKVVDVRVEIEKGYKYFLAEVRIEDEEFRDIEEEVNEELPAILSYEKLDRLFSQVYRRLKERGYFDGEVGVEILMERVGDILVFVYVLRVNKGKRYEYGGNLIYGADRTSFREVNYMLVKGRYFSRKLEEESTWNLIESEIFRSARIDNFIDREKKKVYRLVYLEERKRGLFELGLGYSTYEGFKYELGLTLRNLLGIGLINRNRYSKSELYEIYEFSLRDNFLFSRRFFGEIKLFKSYEDHASYDLFSDGGTLLLGLRITRRFPLGISYTGFRARTEGAQELRVRGSKLSFLANYAGLFELRYSLAWGERDYSSAELSGRFSRELWGGWGFRQKLSVGRAWGSVPIFDRFFLGGFRFMKGYSYESIGSPSGGKAYLYLSPEIYYLVRENVELIGGLEAGNVGKNFGSILEGLKYNLLLSAGLRTPVGLIRADVAYPLDGESPSLNKLKFYLSVDFRL
ncbi:MAG: BamA/TamA family outer membrane protein [Aquificae bacterium]|nr:BamA/TamA family outer membrane protein [Aquificota bacterium]